MTCPSINPPHPQPFISSNHISAVSMSSVLPCILISNGSFTSRTCGPLKPQLYSLHHRPSITPLSQPNCLSHHTSSQNGKVKIGFQSWQILPICIFKHPPLEGLFVPYQNSCSQPLPSRGVGITFRLAVRRSKKLGHENRGSLESLFLLCH